MCKPDAETDCVAGPEFVDGRPRRRQGASCCCWPRDRFDCSTRPAPSRTSPTRVTAAVSVPAPRFHGPPRRRPLRLRARPAPARARARSPVSTRPAAAPAPARWSPAPRSCPTGKAGHRPRAGRLQAAHREGARALLRPGRAPGRGLVGRGRRATRSATGSACTWPTSRRCVARSPCSTLPPAYVLTDGFPVDGLGVPGLAVWKGDRVAACIAAASVLAKVTRDRIMTELDADVAGVRLQDPQGLHHRRARRRARASTARRRCTGCGSSTCGGPRGSSRRVARAESSHSERRPPSAT